MGMNSYVALAALPFVGPFVVAKVRENAQTSEDAQCDCAYIQAFCALASIDGVVLTGKAFIEVREAVFKEIQVLLNFSALNDVPGASRNRKCQQSSQRLAQY